MAKGNLFSKRHATKQLPLFVYPCHPQSYIVLLHPPLLRPVYWFPISLCVTSGRLAEGWMPVVGGLYTIFLVLSGAHLYLRISSVCRASTRTI